jgi:acetate kinase
MENTTQVILTINAGSSTVKCGLFTCESAPTAVAREVLEPSSGSAATSVLAWVDRHSAHQVAAIGHRVVHGGPDFTDPQLITANVLQKLRGLVPFAPNHLPDEIALIDEMGRRLPAIPQVACFDTAFHQSMPPVARRLPIPSAYDARGVRRYGFHGLSYAYLVEELRRQAGPVAAEGRVILAHLGSGSSLAAVRAGRSLDTTMAFTPMAGVVMSSRSGDLDPGVVTYLLRHERLSVDEVEDVLSQRAGLLGVSGVSGSMQELLQRAPTDPACALAVESYVYSVAKAVASLAAALAGVDILVFAGGIGEHAPLVRGRICDRLAFLGVRLDAAWNEENASVIASPSSRVDVRVIPTNEELMISRAAYRLLHETTHGA